MWSSTLYLKSNHYSRGENDFKLILKKVRRSKTPLQAQQPSAPPRLVSGLGFPDKGTRLNLHGEI